MLLRRVIVHVKDQNWFAVAIDFGIVVVGVVIGIQVSNWNEGRKANDERREQLHQIHEEILLTERIWVDNTADFQDRATPLFELRKSMFGFGEPLSKEQYTAACESIISFLSIAEPFYSIATLEEIVRSGRLEEFRDSEFRANAILLAELYESLGIFVEAERSRLINLPFEFPDLISFGLKEVDFNDDQDGVDPTATCDFAAMRSNKKFMNGLSTNITVIAAHADRYLSGRIKEVQQAFHASVDRQLGITHIAQ